MSFKTVLCVLGVDQSDADLGTAIDLCEEADAHLSVLVLAIAAPPPIGELAAMASEAWLEERQEDMARLRARTAEVTELLAKPSLSSDVTSEYAETSWADDAVGIRARYADLVVFGPELVSDRDLKRTALKGVFFAGQRPALLLTERAKATLKPKKIVIAWDSDLEASRAVHEGLELIKAADDVHVVLVDPRATDRGNGEEPGADIAAYLARHGAKVTVDCVPKAGHSVADALRVRASDLSADMLIMGAYGHSRMRERIFGGVTHTIIEEPTLPVFMAR